MLSSSLNGKERRSVLPLALGERQGVGAIGFASLTSLISLLILSFPPSPRSLLTFTLTQSSPPGQT